MKKALKKILNFFGYQILKIEPFPPGAAERPVGDMKKILQDVKARGLNCKAILDIGAHIGSWSVMAKEVFPDAKYCLIEPQYELEEYLKSFVSESAGSLYILAGAGAKVEKKYLTVSGEPAGSSFLPEEDDALKNSGKQREIEIITIDDIISNNKFPVPEVVKIDIQGYELEALKGAELLFGKTELFILECSLFSFSDSPGMPIVSEIVNFMSERDYLIYDFAGFSRRPRDGALGQLDLCFVKRHSFLRSSNDWH